MVLSENSVSKVREGVQSLGLKHAILCTIYLNLIEHAIIQTPRELFQFVEMYGRLKEELSCYG